MTGERRRGTADRGESQADQAGTGWMLKGTGCRGHGGGDKRKSCCEVTQECSLNVSTPYIRAHPAICKAIIQRHLHSTCLSSRAATDRCFSFVISYCQTCRCPADSVSDACMRVPVVRSLCSVTLTHPKKRSYVLVAYVNRSGRQAGVHTGRHT